LVFFSFLLFFNFLFLQFFFFFFFFWLTTHYQSQERVRQLKMGYIVQSIPYKYNLLMVTCSPVCLSLNYFNFYDKAQENPCKILFSIKPYVIILYILAFLSYFLYNTQDLLLDFLPFYSPKVLITLYCNGSSRYAGSSKIKMYLLWYHVHV
jgi:hypothetical protein